MKRCRTCDQHAVDPMLNGLCCDCAIAAQQASTGAAPMRRREVMGRDREILEIVARYCGKTSSIYRYIAQDIAALTREAAPQASGGDGWQRMTDEARAIQLRHLDNHQGDVYHAMQHLAVCFGYRDTRPLTQPIATTDSAIQSQQGATGGAVAWIWEERTYSGHWEVKTGLSVPEYHEAEKWVRNARPLVYGCLAHPQAAGSAPGEAQREVVREGVARGTIKHYRNIPPPPAPPPPQRTQPSGSVASGAVRGEVTDEMVDKFNEVRLRVSGELSVYEHTRETLRRWLECIHG